MGNPFKAAWRLCAGGLLTYAAVAACGAAPASATVQVFVPAPNLGSCYSSTGIPDIGCLISSWWSLNPGGFLLNPPTTTPLTINPTAITENVGSSDPAPTYTLSGFNAGDTASTIGLTGTAACAITQHDSAPGVYPGVIACTPGTLASTARYTFQAGSAAALTILGPPSVSLTSPASGQAFNLNQAVPTSFSCAEAVNAPGIVSCGDSGGASNGSGSLDTSTPGSHSYSVTATSGDGLTAVTSISYVVRGAPVAHISSPASGATYAVGQVVPTAFWCGDPPTAPGIASCADSNGAAAGSDGTGQGSLDTSRPGLHFYSVAVKSKDGQTAEMALAYTVLAGPAAQIAQPVGGSTYQLGQAVATAFSCADDAAGPGLASCTDSNGAKDGVGRLDTSSAGPHTYSVTGVSRDGQRASSSIQYTVAAPPAPKPAPPTIVVRTPQAGQTFTVGQSVHTSFACTEGAGGPGLVWCADQSLAPSGALLPTSVVGRHTISFGAVSKDGLSDLVAVTYTVTPRPTKKH